MGCGSVGVDCGGFVGGSVRRGMTVGNIMRWRMTIGKVMRWRMSVGIDMRRGRRSDQTIGMCGGLLGLIIWVWK